ncbi:FecR family protein [Tistrella mobilis]|nr:FecR domain-containing protein [Tistrella mobilis]
MNGKASMRGDEKPVRASDWLVRLHDAPGDAGLRERFDAWLAANPDHQRDWAEISRTYRLMGQVLPAPGAAPARKAELHSLRPRRRMRMAVAGLALAAGIAAIAVLPGQLRSGLADQSTGSAETRQVALADGSRMDLAPRSAADVEIDAIGRRIRLIQGRAYFEVATDPTRPFVVSAGPATVTVRGTGFEVAETDTGLEVAVRHGRVEVAAGGASRLLEAGDRLTIRTNGDIMEDRSRADEVAAWTSGQLIARDRPVAEVVAALRPYAAQVIVLSDDDLARQPLTGIYDLRRPRAALDAIAAAQGARVVEITPWILLLSKKI